MKISREAVLAEFVAMTAFVFIGPGSVVAVAGTPGWVQQVRPSLSAFNIAQIPNTTHAPQNVSHATFAAPGPCVGLHDFSYMGSVLF